MPHEGYAGYRNKGPLMRAWEKYYAAKGIHPRSNKMMELVFRRAARGKWPGGPDA